MFRDFRVLQGYNDVEWNMLHKGREGSHGSVVIFNGTFGTLGTLL